MKAKELVYRGTAKAVEEWASNCMNECYENALEGWTALECHEEAAQELGAWRHKVSDLYGMGLIGLEHFDSLMQYCDTCMRSIADYIWDCLYEEVAQ